MSLRKSPQLTPALLAAARRNGRHSTGPRSAAAKQNVKLNSLKHGGRVSDENRRQAMQALGEDPREFENLKQELMSALTPGDALWEKQIDDLAWLYWRRERLERAEAGLQRRALQAIDDWQHRRQQEMARITFDASQPWAIDIDMTEPADPGVRLRMLLSFLEVIRAQVKQRTFKLRQASEIETLYHNDVGWRQARLLALLRLFNESFGPGAEPQEPELKEMLSQQLGPRESAGEPQYQELLRLLDEETAHVQEEFQHAEKVNEEKAAVERDAALAPQGETWSMMLRQEGSLDRSIDRKVRILLALRREYASGSLPDMTPDGDSDTDMTNMEKISQRDASSETPEPVGAVGNTKMRERSLNVHENKGSFCETPERSWNVNENRGSYASSPGMCLKMKG